MLNQTKQQEWICFFNKKHSTEDISLMLNDLFYINELNNDATMFFKNYIFPVINNSSGKKWIDNEQEIKEMLIFFTANTKYYVMEEEIFFNWCNCLSLPKYNFISAIFFNNMVTNMGISNAFKCINYETNINENILKRICKSIMLSVEKDSLLFESINTETINLKSIEKKDFILNSFFCIKNELIQNFCKEKYWVNFDEQRKVTIVESILTRKGTEIDLSFYNEEIKLIFNNNIKKISYFEKLSGTLNKNKIYLYVNILNELKNEENTQSINNALYKMIDKCLFNKSENIYHFIDIKRNAPELLPSEFMLLVIYRSVHVLKKEIANNLISDIFLLARDINEESWFQKELYDFEKKHDLGFEVNFGKHERVKQTIISHMYSSFSYTMGNDNKDKKKLKI